MKEQELNKKLAEWAGFKYENVETPYTQEWMDKAGHHKEPFRIDIWWYPDSSNTLDHVTDEPSLNGLPDFPESLDACFKWLVPKLLGYSLFNQSDKHIAMVVPYKGDSSICDNGKTPALALCLAIEKLIDSEVASYESTTDKWLKARCPICGLEYKYPEGGYKPETCSNFECVHKFLHPEIYDLRFRKELDELKSERR